ncbi:reverse transcriptase domain-containing protein [Agarivorans sp. QJM3NY_29]|uniref:reverse transcriptase domain-containing protein n=1 Tax=unclassified Agarivorans TaxID=2636026 RepID=UPI003D7DDD84
MLVTISEVFTPDNLRDIYISNFSQSKVTGIDNLLPKHFAKKQSKEINTIISKVFIENYAFSRYREKLISKGANKYPRQIAIPTLRDRIVLKAINNYLQRNFSHLLQIQVPQQATRDVKLALDTNTYETVIKIDIKDFYPTIEHHHLENHLKNLGVEKEVITLIRSAVTTGFSKNQVCHSGVPQGLSISNILAEIYMLDIDKALKKEDIFYKRYVDDVLIFCREDESGKIYDKYVEETKLIGLKTHDDPVNNSV